MGREESCHSRQVGSRGQGERQGRWGENLSARVAAAVRRLGGTPGPDAWTAPLVPCLDLLPLVAPVTERDGGRPRPRLLCVVRGLEQGCSFSPAN